METAAEYESSMKQKLADLKLGKPLQAEKAVVETVKVLKQFGYDSGADSFEKIMYEAVKNNAIKLFDV